MSELLPYQVLLRLLLSNGPGTISVPGAKSAVSAAAPPRAGLEIARRALAEPESAP